ncbi:hypothetical protein ACFL2T_05315 [Elusimicrobiota bacterium]
MAKQANGIKPQDLLVLLKLVSNRNPEWRNIDFAQELGISNSEVGMALERARHVGLFDPSKRRLLTTPFLEFLIHGLKYVFPARLGAVCRGVPTSHSAPPLAGQIVSEEHDQYVWAHDDGKVRGQSVPPLYPSAPQAALRDPQLHELLALVDALRVGRARERQIAAQELGRRLKEYSIARK